MPDQQSETPLRLKNLMGACPPDGYRYVFPETGHTVHAWTYYDWVQAAKDHLAANSLPVPDQLGERMQHQLCMTLPPGWCDYDDPNRPRPSTSLTWNDVAGGVATFTRWLAAGAKSVVQDEADRRALICSRCYLNVNVQGCAGCHKAVVEVVRNRKTKYDFALRSCAACRCFLRAKVHFPLSILDKSGVDQALYPSFCWLKLNGPNRIDVQG